MCNPVYNTIITIFIGAIIGTICTYIGAIRLARFNNKIVAGTRLRETFNLELITLNNKNNFLNISNIIKSRFIEQQTAVNEFRLFLTNKELITFNKAWNEYYEYKCKSIEGPTGQQWAYLSNQSERDNNIKLIENIIAFTKHKSIFSCLTNCWSGR
ncbi:MAG: hypothetical protein SV062_08110 [Thermodesulfobacteriota bacterium]|nr:hypothetical protein [Thermodesulfobacteriota bacterium]